jgi:putative membrane protein
MDPMTGHDSGRGSADRMADTGTGAASRIGDTTVSAADREFMMKAAQGGMMEVELGRLAQDRGTDEDVKDLGKMLVEDHSAANDRLKQIANETGVTLPTSLDGKHQATVNKFANLSGANFDRQFMQHSVQAHQKDIQAFRTAAQSGMNEKVKAFASETLPKLEQHLQHSKTGNNWASSVPGTSARYGFRFCNLLRFRNASGSQ